MSDASSTTPPDETSSVGATAPLTAPEAPPELEPDSVADSAPTSSNASATSPPRTTLRQRRRAALVERVAYTDRQRRAMVLVLTVVLGVLLWRVVRDRAYVSDPQPTKPARFDELADRLDPNVAPWEELVALPTLGEKRAKAIVEYRDDWHARHPNEPAFKSLIDLAGVKGIGASTLENIGPHVMFPTPAPGPVEPATRPRASAAPRSAAKWNP